LHQAGNGMRCGWKLLKRRREQLAADDAEIQAAGNVG